MVIKWYLSIGDDFSNTKHDPSPPADDSESANTQMEKKVQLNPSEMSALLSAPAWEKDLRVSKLSYRREFNHTFRMNKKTV